MRRAARLTTFVLLYVAGALAFATPSPALAAPVAPALSFTGDAVVSTADSTIMDIRVLAGDDGSATVVWTEANGWYRRVMASTRLPGTTSWSAPAELSGPSVSPRLRELAVGGAADGAVTVVWEQGVTGPSEIYSATRAAGVTSWSPPVRISTPDATRGDSSAMMVRADGSAIVAWATFPESNGVLYATRGAGSGAAWSAPKTLETGGGDDSFRRLTMTEGPGGDISLLYAHTNIALPADVVRSTTMAAGSTTFSAPADAATAPPYGISSLAAVAQPNGDLTVAWQRSVGRDGAATLMAARRAGGLWQAPTQISTDAVDGLPLRLAADRLGAVMLMWTASDDRHDRSHYRVRAATKLPAESWSVPFHPAGSDQVSAFGQMLDVGGWTVGLWVAGPASEDWAPQDWAPRYAIANSLGAGFGAPAAFGSTYASGTTNAPAFAAGRTGMVAAAWQDPDYAIRVATAAAGQLPPADPEPDPLPIDRPAPGPGPAPAPGDQAEQHPAPEAPAPTPRARRLVRELQIKGRTVTVDVRVTLKRRARCSGHVTAASRITGSRKTTRHRQGLKLKSVWRNGKKTCIVRGSFTVPQAPTAERGLRVTFRHANIAARALTATRVR